MKLRIVLSVILLLIFTASASSKMQDVLEKAGPEKNWKEAPEVANLFAQNLAEGTFVVYDVTDDKLIGFDQKRAKTRFVPASTFKIFNALIGLAAGSVKDVDEILPWGWEPQPFKEWEKDMSLREAMKISCVPIYQELALRTGLTAMQAKINEIGYGNTKIGDRLDRFWLEGPLEISAVEQVKLLARLARNDLPFKTEDMAAVREIVKLEEGHGWALYGKTGAAALKAGPRLGWWVGWVEKEGRIYAFALNLDLLSPKDLPKRIELGRTALENLGILG